MRARIQRTRDGGLRVRLDAGERDLLRSLPGQLRELLEDTPDDPSLRRLFPPASDDEEVEGEYRRLMAPDLRDRRLSALAVMESTVDAERLSEDEAAAWLSALNDMRLVLGTRLDVTEDLDPSTIAPDDPRAPGLALYGYLSWIVEQLVEALAAP
ncbi:MAG TPA: DUF2017 family protein [Acidimicrobiales bacterium]|nr:DUF2017 family protein [Acidimicrobiales bacterium]